MSDMLQKPDLPDVTLDLSGVTLPPIVLDTDGQEYEVLVWAARSTVQLSGLSAEVGVREGGSSEMILRAVADEVDTTKRGHITTHVAIDPYGNIPYEDRDGRTVPGFGYNESMRRRSQASLSTIARSLDTNLLFLPIKDSDFFRWCSSGVPIYERGEERRENRYRLAHIDGPHAYMPVADAAHFFGERTVLGGCLVFDNIDYYDHGAIHREVLQPLGFELIHVGEAKALHRRAGWS